MRNELSGERRQLLQQLEDEGKLILKYSMSEYAWIRHFSALIEYSKAHGHCNIQQRNQFECILPFNFLNAYAALAEDPFVDDLSTMRGTTSSTSSAINVDLSDDGQVHTSRVYRARLGRWLDHQRSLKKKGALSSERMKALNILVHQGMSYIVVLL